MACCRCVHDQDCANLSVSFEEVFTFVGSGRTSVFRRLLSCLGIAVGGNVHSVVASLSLHVNLSRLMPVYRAPRPSKQLLLEMAQNHLESVARSSVELARHRNSDVVELRDVQLCLGENASASERL